MLHKNVDVILSGAVIRKIKTIKNNQWRGCKFASSLYFC